MPILRIAGRRNVGVVDYDEPEEKKVSYYRECLQYGLQIPLKNRIYPKGEYHQIMINGSNATIGG